ncbi:MAG: hypothetical protein IPH54_20755 [Rhodoferax sp.]|nr:hypothetical protein [Rhodoferax sp.]
MELLKSNPDECLSSRSVRWPTPHWSYCATHALLCAVVCELTAEKLGVSDMARNTLFNAALVMNIGMAWSRTEWPAKRPSSTMPSAS